VGRRTILLAGYCFGFAAGAAVLGVLMGHLIVAGVMPGWALYPVALAYGLAGAVACLNVPTPMPEGRK
jgi:hypothetical protein